MTQAEIIRTIQYVLAESSRWLLHRRRDTKQTNIPGCRKKKKEKKRKEKRKTKSRKQGTKKKQARKSYSRRPHSNKSSRLCYVQSRDGDLATPSAIFFLLSSATVSSVAAATVEPTHPVNKSTKTKQNCLDSGAVATQVPLISRTGTLIYLVQIPVQQYISHELPQYDTCLLYTSPSPRDKRQSRMPSSA